MSRRIALVNSLVKKSELKVLLSLFNVHSNDIPELRNKNELKKYFGSINEDNQNIFLPSSRTK